MSDDVKLLAIERVSEVMAGDGRAVIVASDADGGDWEIEIAGDLARQVASLIIALSDDLASKAVPGGIPSLSAKAVTAGTVRPGHCRLVIDLNPSGQLVIAIDAELAGQTGLALAEAADQALALEKKPLH